MEYQKRSVNGDAGEYLVAFKVTRIFGWPCRLLDVDLGVDGEMEIMADDGTSTGDVIKIQVKSFDRIDSVGAKNVYVSERHISYWKRFCLPVIICCVDLTAEKVYWKQIVPTDDYESSGVANRISLDLARDELTPTSKSALLTMVTPEASKQIEVLFEKARTLLSPLEDRAMLMVDGEELSEIERECDALQEVVAKIENLLGHFPWRASTMALRELAIIKRNVQITLNDANHSYSVGVNGM